MLKKTEIEQFTASFCEAAADRVGPNYFRTRRLEFVLQRMLLPELFSDRYQRALELGCGIGFKALLMREFAEQVDGIDIDQPYHGFMADVPSINIGKELLSRIGIDGIRLRSADFLTFMNEHHAQYDLIYSDYLLEHVPDLPSLYTAILAALKPGGLALHIVPNTHDALIQLSNENLRPTLSALKRVAKASLSQAFSGSRRRPKMTGVGYFMPETHSEFISDFRDQFEVFRIENYVFPMIEAGFTIEKIVPLREHSYGISCRK